MDVVAHLRAFVAEDPVFAAFEIAFHEIGEKAMELDAGVVRAGQATTAEAAGGNSEVGNLLLHHDIGCHLGGAKE
jgi:hypothetical protein